MRARWFLQLAGASSVAFVGVLGLSGSSALAAPAQTMHAADLPPIYPSPSPNGALPSGGPGVKIVGTCPGWLFTDPVGFQFTSGNAVEYQIPPGAPPGVSNGANVEGTATLMDGLNPTAFSGHTHLWFGQNSNPTGNLENYFGETISFSGTDGTNSISITANPGFIQSASGHQSGWGQVKVTCS
jgi:hypothetical protein